MARQGCETLALLVLALAAFATARLPAQAAAPSDGSPATFLLAAKNAFSLGEAQSALDSLRQLRADFPDSPSAIESFALSVEYCIALGDEYRARYFLRRLLDGSPGSPAAFRASILVARHAYDARSWLAAGEYFKAAADGYRDGVSAPREDLDLALLRAAELSLYHENDPDTARAYFSRIVPRNLPGAETPLYREMRVRLLWHVISPARLGLNDANVSSLRVDGDDIWVGTWNGGVARYSVSAGQSDPFPAPAYSRSIEVADRRVWIGTAEGLAWYGKGSGRWGSENDFRLPTPRKVQVVREAAGALYAGTLGDGLFRRDDSGWEEVSDGDLPGRFITCIAPDPSGGRLFIGTMNIGLVILDMSSGAMTTLAEIAPAFTPENITTILPDPEGRIWIGTYGEGLFVWTPNDGAVRHFARATGEIADDWILASCETDRALYFGSFGGGVSVYMKQTGAWRRIGISDGLASLDVPAIAWRAPFLFFGTLGAGISVYDEAADGAQP